MVWLISAPHTKPICLNISLHSKTTIIGKTSSNAFQMLFVVASKYLTKNVNLLKLTIMSDTVRCMLCLSGVPHISPYVPKYRHAHQIQHLLERGLKLFVVTSKYLSENFNLLLMIIDFQTYSYGLLGKRSPHPSTYFNIFPLLPTHKVGKKHAIAFSEKRSPYPQSPQLVERVLMLFIVTSK